MLVLRWWLRRRVPVSHSRTTSKRAYHQLHPHTRPLSRSKVLVSTPLCFQSSSASSAVASTVSLSSSLSPSSSSSSSSTTWSVIKPLLRRRPIVHKKPPGQARIMTEQPSTSTPAPVAPAPVAVVTTEPSTTLAKPSFYRRALPSECIGFSSREGRQIFAQALSSDPNYMQIYFPLAEQFTTQAEPAFCGLATLAMCLNALEIDPKRCWKGVWRWFSEELFECCTSLSVAKEKGISFTEFICLAKCNGVQTESMRADGSFSLAEFRSIVKRCCATSEEILVLNYSRQALNQTGDGHFSPIGGYHEEKDMVLLLDVARFKYPPHWVQLSVVYEAMHRIDTTSGLPRGLVVLKQNALPNQPCQSSTVSNADMSTGVGVSHYHHHAQTMSKTTNPADSAITTTVSSTAATISTAAVSRWSRQFPW